MFSHWIVWSIAIIVVIHFQAIWKQLYRFKTKTVRLIFALIRHFSRTFATMQFYCCCLVLLLTYTIRNLTHTVFSFRLEHFLYSISILEFLRVRFYSLCDEIPSSAIPQYMECATNIEEKLLCAFAVYSWRKAWARKRWKNLYSGCHVGNVCVGRLIPVALKSMRRKWIHFHLSKSTCDSHWKWNGIRWKPELCNSAIATYHV